ncbi:MAG: polyprenyl synthetase family protein [Thermoguttaceae bacterium]
MIQRTSHSQPATERLRFVYAPIRAELDEVEDLLRGEVRSDFAFIDRLAQHGFQLGGKRLRPALVLLSGLATGPLDRNHLVAAAVLELIHTATLIHDDVLDEANLRRHLQTVNAGWGNEASVLLGDYLFARSICMAATFSDVYVTRAISDATRVMCEGELRQVGTRGCYDLSEQEYLDIVAAKTAELCACCCRLGAHFSGAAAEVEESLVRYGRFLGIAFQIIDDVLDVRGNEAVTGKSLGTDLMKQKPTLPIIRLLAEVSPAERTELLAMLCRPGDHHARTLASWFERCDAISYAGQQAVLYARRARGELDRLEPTPARESLQGLADFVVTRDL